MKKLIFDCLSSTQIYVKENIDKLKDTYVIAKTQTNGRGRTGRSWISSDENLMFSYFVNPLKINKDNYSLITLLTGLAVRDTFASITNDDSFQIKWPNDIVYNGKKVCGIIAEGIFKNNGYYIVIGIGMNINQIKFDETIYQTASSLKLITNKNFDKDKVLEVFDIKFKKYYQELENNNKSFIQKIDEYNYLKNKEVTINNDQYNNQLFEVVKINDNGNILLRDKNNNFIEMNSNEITLHNNYK